MLDQDTKRKIDNARDILVGKIPTPNGQVEQITIALIFKFMDDMEKESEEMGGKVSFFTDGFEKYAWSKIFDPRLGGHELVALYGEAIERMNHNPNIPQLFRNIFKNAYLPYRDPETLKMFLKEINEFRYDHSEQLGDAFEYLLSVLGSQGDAGSFRTPRHIIDFIVEIVDPKKNDMVLDPACGTAGFLISSYRHILKANKELKNGDLLTNIEKTRLMNNFIGHDIAPEMMRLSLVNMYLHGFSDPKIYEYDTLTSEDRWDETYDVILANPPFMTPKGGIRPHKRFSIQAKRSEVLFVDYIAEHLNPHGRAGVIVPEGIIFQSQNAYKNLRKMLVDDYLWAVVSLPGGVFNPYSGVKTSILLMDRSLSKKTDKILFVKIENDGYDLGAQRRPIAKDDLPKALEYIRHYRQAVMTNNEIADADFAHAVEKERIAKSGDWILSGERYKDLAEIRTEWDLVELGEILNYEQPTKYIVESTEYNDSYEIPVLTAGKSFILGYANEKEGIFKDGLPVIIFDDFTTATKFIDFPFKVKSSAMKILHAIKEKANPKFVYHVIQQINFPVNEHKRYWISQYSKIKIPLPPLDVQKAIVDEIEGYQKIIDGARQVVNNYKPTIKIDPEWEIVPLGEIAKIICGQSPQGEFYNENADGLPFYQGKIEFSDIFICEPKKWTTQITKEAFEGDILMSVRAPVGPVNIATKHCCIGRGLAAIRVGDRVERIYLFSYLKSIQDRIKGSGGAVFDSISRNQISKLQIPLPLISIQQEIVTQIEAEQEIVNGNKKLIEMFEQKIKDKIAEVWGTP